MAGVYNALDIASSSFCEGFSYVEGSAMVVSYTGWVVSPVLLKFTEQVLCGEVGCIELPSGAVKGSEIHRNG
jgi:hypothetical protein